MTAPPLRLGSPDELLAVIPHLLGFQPHQAIVVLALRNHQIGLTQRIDLPAPERLEEVANSLVRHVLRDDADAALLVAYEDVKGASDAVIEQVTERLIGSEVSIRDRLIVRGGRWRSLDCGSPGCCPPEGNPLPSDAEVASSVAEFIGRGSAPLRDRAALVAQVEAVPAAREVEEVIRRERDASPTMKEGSVDHELAEAWARILSGHTAVIDVRDAALALRSLNNSDIRDGITSLLIPNGPNLDVLPASTRALLQAITEARARQGRADIDELTAADVKANLITLCHYASDEHAAPVLSLLATHSWWHGDGATARVALDRALRCDPDYRLAQLLTLMLDEGIRPEPS